mmetsp:Transcript_14247/g.56080  ORF Transcript_14247/g.56080 Transcript_14247/m.56080 type:complete len:252 (-) Transcript_14247:281-1036(-)
MKVAEPWTLLRFSSCTLEVEGSLSGVCLPLPAPMRDLVFFLRLASEKELLLSLPGETGTSFSLVLPECGLGLFPGTLMLPSFSSAIFALGDFTAMPTSAGSSPPAIPASGVLSCGLVVDCASLCPRTLSSPLCLFVTGSTGIDSLSFDLLGGVGGASVRLFVTLSLGERHSDRCGPAAFAAPRKLSPLLADSCGLFHTEWLLPCLSSSASCSSAAGAPPTGSWSLSTVAALLSVRGGALGGGLGDPLGLCV